MRMKLVEFLRQHICVRYEVILSAAIFFLRFDKVKTKAVFAGNLVGHGEMVDSLVLIETLVQEGFAGGAAPEDIPLVRICVAEIVGLQQGSHQLGVPVEQLVQAFEVVQVVASAGLLLRRHVVQELAALDRSDNLQLVYSVVGCCVVIVIDVPIAVDFLLLIEVLGCPRLCIAGRGDQQRVLLLNILQGFKNFKEELIALLLQISLRERSELSGLVTKI